MRPLFLWSIDMIYRTNFFKSFSAEFERGRIKDVYDHLSNYRDNLIRVSHPFYMSSSTFSKGYDWQYFSGKKDYVYSEDLDDHIRYFESVFGPGYYRRVRVSLSDFKNPYSMSSNLASNKLGFTLPELTGSVNPFKLLSTYTIKTLISKSIVHDTVENSDLDIDSSARFINSYNTIAFYNYPEGSRNRSEALEFLSRHMSLLSNIALKSINRHCAYALGSLTKSIFHSIVGQISRAIESIIFIKMIVDNYDSDVNFLKSYTSKIIDGSDELKKYPADINNAYLPTYLYRRLEEIELFGIDVEVSGKTFNIPFEDLMKIKELCFDIYFCLSIEEDDGVIKDISLDINDVRFYPEKMYRNRHDDSYRIIKVKYR